MHRYTVAAGIIAALALSGCAVGTGPTPRAAVMALEDGLIAANHSAMTYMTLPACTPTGTPVCRDTNTASLIKIAALKAYMAVTAAQDAADRGLDATSTEAAVTAATAAIAAFQATVPLPTKGK